MPSGIAVLGSDLYIAAVSTVYKVADVDQQLTSNPRTTVVTNSLPKERQHGWKYLKSWPRRPVVSTVGPLVTSVCLMTHDLPPCCA